MACHRFDMTATLQIPPAGDQRWTPRRKADVCCAIFAGALTMEEAAERWDMTLPEIASWLAHFRDHGKNGLSTTKLQDFRPCRTSGSSSSPQSESD